MPIKRIIAFDFDDTLAHTVSTIGIRRLLPDGSEDLGFEDFLLDNNIQYVRKVFSSMKVLDFSFFSFVQNSPTCVLEASGS